FSIYPGYAASIRNPIGDQIDRDRVMPNLHTLIEAEDLDGLAAALSGGADVDTPGHCGATPLMTAIKRKDRAAFDLLLAHGADPDRTDDFNHTALHEAVEWDWVEA